MTASRELPVRDELVKRRVGDTARVATALLIACHAGPPITTAPLPVKPTGAAAIEVISCIDLPRGDPRSHDLSGLAWDPAERLLYAVSDRDPRIVVLAPRLDFAGYDFRPSIALDLPVERWDGEALAFADDRFLVVADETAQAVFSVDRAGRDAVRVPLPWFPGTRHNKGIEGLSYSASSHGRYIFAINEEALEGDGPSSTVEHGTVVRLLRHPLDGEDDLEVAYMTDPIFVGGAPGDNGVSDLVALSPERVLVLERAHVRGNGNSVRLYDVDLRAGEDIAALADARAVVPIAKRLVVDLALVPDQRCPLPPQWQRRRTLENYEGLALGPTLRDGRRVVFLISDDNSRLTQSARLIALALAPNLL